MMQHGVESPSRWVIRFAPMIVSGARVLDLACGAGRHARLLAGTYGATVLAVDRDPAALENLKHVANVETRCVDLEAETWPLQGETFDAVIVTNYLWRPRFDDVLALIASDGVLIYETFAAGNEAFGKPSRADFLLQPNELLARVRNRLQIVAFEQGRVESPKAAVVQRIVAVGAERGWPTVLRDA
jgi:SAM-dependent methyltransferase